VTAGGGYHHVMSAEPTVLHHLHDGRDALALEIARLTAALADLDAVIATLGGRPAAESTDDTTVDAIRSALAENGTFDPDAPAGGPVAPPVVGHTRPRNRPAAPKNAGPARSIRERVLDMLAEQDRSFGLAEIIDRIRADGVRAHDDAVRSITVKLMKDGRVERVGRGQYRLAAAARRGSNREGATGQDATGQDATGQRGAPEPPEPDAHGALPEESDLPPTPPLNLAAPWVSPRP
jgi:hypothetical protein